MICIACQILSSRLKPRSVQQACDRRQISTEFLREDLNKRHHLEAMGIEERIILKRILRKVWEGVTWVHKEKCWVLFKTVMNFCCV